MPKVSRDFHVKLREERIREAQTKGVALEIAARIAAGESVSPGDQIPWAAADASGEVSVTEEMIAAAVEYYRDAREAVRSEMDVDGWRIALEERRKVIDWRARGFGQVGFTTRPR